MTLHASYALVDGVRDDIGDVAPVVIRGVVCLAEQVQAGGYVPQSEARVDAAIARAADAAGDEC